MKKAEDKLREKISKRIEVLSREELQYIDVFIDTLEHKDSSKEKILSFAGVFDDIDTAVFNDLTDQLHENRQKGDHRIQ